MSTPSTPAPPPSERPPDPGRRMVWLGASAGAGIPLLAFAAVFLGGSGWLIGSWTWGAVAFIGVALQISPRTKRFGVGMLLGFVGLVVAGAGACTASVFTMA